MSKFKIGDIVICLNNDTEHPWRMDKDYTKGNKYLVTMVYQSGRVDTKCLLTGYKNAWGEHNFVLDPEYKAVMIMKEVLEET